jgi:hypothetical protein
MEIGRSGYMEWLDAMNKAVEYLEDNITERLDIEKAAKIALSSTFHFQRMYHMITGTIALPGTKIDTHFLTSVSYDSSIVTLSSLFKTAPCLTL